VFNQHQEWLQGCSHIHGSECEREITSKTTFCASDFKATIQVSPRIDLLGSKLNAYKDVVPFTVVNASQRKPVKPRFAPAERSKAPRIQRKCLISAKNAYKDVGPFTVVNASQRKPVKPRFAPAERSEE
jgi:hypothetical protein